MRLSRYLLCLVLVAGLVFLTGALRTPPVGEPEESPLMPAVLTRLLAAAPDAAAAAEVARSIAELSDPDGAWLRTEVHVRCLIPELRFTGAGSYVRAPGQRFRLEVQTRVESDGVVGEATLLAVSDGSDLWQATRRRDHAYGDVRRLRLAEMARNTDTPQRAAQLRDRLLAGPGIRGPEQMLRSINHLVGWVPFDRQADERTLVGVWLPALKRLLAADGEPWPAHLPRLCRLTLQGPRRWPARLEWWGPISEGGPDRLLSDIEFRRPVRGQAIPDDECARLFHFHPGSAEVTDTTATVRAQVDPRP